ncbi:hypothetical protein QYF52_01640 [Paenibacillus polymyxa]|uniref:hypothetical protein n=1 Tax=Paenibacillus polymyxa TaxID=1406 RepID=UPI0025B6F101|nr:hypothetical protein [Paenibacillus polymyxa]MDN4076623.1 hypothetical protein [Paenibacillus polymyxa]MDN4082514.1 hypothetical protein [Paenibacillus polymyxa]MDN4086575.1 hypothetical protein [Paenibacillus polymyxa]MDN4102049.1 hypothetical protein [Paenibacillus polymyxa]MDN4109910.1 hypothetical protein [Paenibacillus polymyxa]
MSKDPYGAFVSVMQSSMAGHTRQALSGVGAVLGTITSTGLKLDDFKHELQDYLVAELPGLLSVPRHMYQGTSTSVESENWEGKELKTSFYIGEDELEDVNLSLNKGLKPGDRVLAMRVNSGNDVVVVCKVVNGRG